MRFKERVESELSDIKYQLSALGIIANDLSDLKRLLSQTNKKITKMSKKNDEVLAIVSEMNDETNAIAAKIDGAVAALEAGSVSDETVSSLKAVSDRLKTLAADPAQPIPDPAPPVDEPAPVEPVPTDPNLPA